MRRFTFADENNVAVEFTPDYFEPLTFSDLQQGLESGKFKMKAHISPGNISIDGKRDDTKSTLDFSVKYLERFSALCLVTGGCLPPQAINSHSLLFDRNGIAYIEQSNAGRVNDNETVFSWWLKSVQAENIHVNPILYAVEGDKNRTPTFTEFKNSIVQATNELRTYFPTAILAEYTDEAIHSKYQLVVSNLERQQREIDFLIKAVPLFVESVPDNKLDTFWEDILKLTKEYNLTTGSFLLLTVAACVFENIHGHRSKFSSPARVLLKPNINYNSRTAYNAIADLRSLEILAAGDAHSEYDLALVTADKAMALMWCGLNFKEATTNSEGTLTFNFKPQKSLFPRMTGNRLSDFKDVTS